MTDYETPLKNNTHHIDARMKSVKQFENIQPLKDLQSMKQQF